jgi:alkylhydroperoxidase family enzyme
LQGEQFHAAAQALRDGDLDAAPVTPEERLLLQFVGTVTSGAHRVTDEQVQALRDVGWTEPQIAEAVYETALFSLFVRLADAFGIEPPPAYEPDGPPAAAM